MSFQPQSLVHVYYVGENDKLLMGRLLLKDRRILFEYDAAFIKKRLELSPFKLPLKKGVIVSNDPTFDGLFGVFNDSLPDGWGRLLLDRKLIKTGVNPGHLSPLDRLCFVGHNGMGALIYEPEKPHEPIVPHKNLDKIADEINLFQEKDDDRFIDDLLTLGGSSAGARPKILINLEGEEWLVKFQSSTDPKDIGNIEYAYHLMAIKAGLTVPNAKLFPSRKNVKAFRGYFGVKRFDRDHGKRIHMHTISGLLHTEHHHPCLDYEIIMKTTLFLTRNVEECERLFRNAVFNVLSHNRDDHAKNFSYLMDNQGVWAVSPAYDLTFSNGPSGEHATMVMGEGKNPGKPQLFKLAAIADIKKNKATEIINEVTDAISQWKHFSHTANVSKSSQIRIQNALDSVRKNGFFD